MKSVEGVVVNRLSRAASAEPLSQASVSGAVELVGAMPNVFLAGVPKAGTSAMAQALARHPQFVVSSIKEPNYFNTDLPFGHFKSRQAYLALFDTKEITPPKFRCDASILYCYSKVAAEQIKANCPSARAVIMLRNPVDVMHAWHGQMVYTGNEPVRDFAKALDAEAGRKRSGSSEGLVGLAARCPQLLWYRALVAYAEQIERFYRHLGRENVCVVLQEDFVRDPQATLAAVLRFVGADASVETEIDRVNEFKVRRAMPVHRLLKRLVATPSIYLLPMAWRHRLIGYWDKLTSRPTERAPMASGLRAELIGELRVEVATTARLIGRDLSAWAK